MPAYNAEKYLREAIDSILSQTFTDFEFIIINDGSTDSTKDIILSYTDPRIIYLENEQNSGICVTLNKGLDAARGTYIARMDADDISLPDRFQKQVAYLSTHPEIGVLGTDIEVFGDSIQPYEFRQLHTPEECSAGLIFNSCFAHPSVMMRRHVLESFNLRYKDKFRGLEDYELWWQLNKLCKLNNLPEILLRYRHHPGQETKNLTPAVISAFQKFIAIRLQDLNICPDEQATTILNLYSIGKFEELATSQYANFISILKKILRNYKQLGDSKLYNAVQLTFAKAITYTINNSSLRPNAQRLYNQAWLKGLFPTIWFVKLSILRFLK